MKTYGDLNLIKVRKNCDLDFAHYTYKPGMCSCCYGPKDLPKRYWKNGIVQMGKNYDDIQYIQFKNADNGSGCVKRKDIINDVEYIEWNIPEDKIMNVCIELQKEFGDDYMVIVPKSKCRCITVYYKPYFKKKYMEMKKRIEDPKLNDWWYEGDKRVYLKDLSMEEVKQMKLKVKVTGNGWCKDMLYARFNCVEVLLRRER